MKYSRGFIKIIIKFLRAIIKESIRSYVVKENKIIVHLQKLFVLFANSEDHLTPKVQNKYCSS